MAENHQQGHDGTSPYMKLALNLAISFVIMYLVMFTMISDLSAFFNNLNMVYMAIMMVAPMAILMIFIMRSMFTNRAANVVIVALFALLFAVSFVFMRQQTAIGDVQFLRSMIPHHSGAILMCGKSKINDAEIRKLCQEIIASQEQEISQMRKILSRL